MIFIPKISRLFNCKTFERCLNKSVGYQLHKKFYSKTIPPFLSHMFTNNINLELLEFPELGSENELFTSISMCDKFTECVTANVESSNTDTIQSCITDSLASNGLFGLLVPSAFGGCGLNKMQFMQTVEKMHFNLPYSLSVLLPHYLVTEALNFSADSDGLKLKYLPGLSSGKMQAIYCIDEDFSNELVPKTFKTHATLSADGSLYRINGLKRNVLNVDPSKLLLIIANKDDKKSAAFIVDPNSRGIVFVPKPENNFNLSGIKNYDVSFTDVVVPVENMLTTDISTHELTKKLAVLEYDMLSGVQLGILKTILLSYYDFVSNREIFGVSLLDYQRLRFDLTAIIKDIFINESMVYFIAGMIDKYPSDDFIMESAATKVYCNNTVSKWTNKLISLLGHSGLHRQNKYPIYKDEGKYLEFHRVSNTNMRSILGKMVIRHILDQNYSIKKDWFTQKLVNVGLIPHVCYTDIHGKGRGHTIDYIHPVCYMLIFKITEQLRKANVKLLSLKIKHGNLLLTDQLLHYKLSDIMLDMWMVFVNVSRVTRVKCLNLPTSRHQIILWGSECQRIESKVKRDFVMLLNYLNSYNPNDDLSLSNVDEMDLSLCHPFYI